MKFSATFAAIAAVAVCSATAAADGQQVSTNAKELLKESMAWMDQYYDSDFGYLYDFGGASALRHETRSSVWYALGLMARNCGSDVEEAEKILSLVVGGQFKNVSQQWYGTYEKYPEEPVVGSADYPSDIYNS